MQALPPIQRSPGVTECSCTEAVFGNSTKSTSHSQSEGDVAAPLHQDTGVILCSRYRSWGPLQQTHFGWHYKPTHTQAAMIFFFLPPKPAG